jgi:hypothetical protein
LSPYGGRRPSNIPKTSAFVSVRTEEMHRTIPCEGQSRQQSPQRSSRGHFEGEQQAQTEAENVQKSAKNVQKSTKNVAQMKRKKSGGQFCKWHRTRNKMGENVSNISPLSSTTTLLRQAWVNY